MATNPKQNSEHKRISDYVSTLNVEFVSRILWEEPRIRNIISHDIPPDEFKSEAEDIIKEIDWYYGPNVDLNPDIDLVAEIVYLVFRKAFLGCSQLLPAETTDVWLKVANKIVPYDYQD